MSIMPRFIALTNLKRGTRVMVHSEPDMQAVAGFKELSLTETSGSPVSPTEVFQIMNIRSNVRRRDRRPTAI